MAWDSLVNRCKDSFTAEEIGPTMQRSISSKPRSAFLRLARLGVKINRDNADLETKNLAAVMVTAPVGLCFLPAFLAIGVLPVVIGLAGGLLKGGAG